MDDQASVSTAAWSGTIATREWVGLQWRTAVVGRPQASWMRSTTAAIVVPVSQTSSTTRIR
jgi:hypothetical protein